MKKLIISFMLLLASPAFAQFDFGAETYTSANSKGLVVNSLGDTNVVSQYQTATQSLGTNDWIPENAVKNTLGMDGYTQAYDYNPTANHSWGVYNTPLPIGPQLHEVDFQGLLGDPRTTQKTYVLQSEWEQFSAQSQDTRINMEASNLAQTNAVVNNHTTQISGLTTGLLTETGARINGDQVLQSQVNATNTRINDVSSRVDKLEQMKVIADINVRLLDTKKYQVGIFDMFDGRAQRNFAAGVRLTYKLGQSYEEKLIEKQQRQLDQLQAALSRLQ